MLPGSLAEGHYAHQRPGLDEHRGDGGMDYRAVNPGEAIDPVQRKFTFP